jgi:hypothetical protein
VLAVLVGFTDYTTQLFTVFSCRLHESILQSIHYSRFWLPDVVCRGGLLMSSLFEGWLRTLLPSSLTILRLFVFAAYLLLTILSLSLMLRPTVSRPVCLGIKHPSGAYDHIFFRSEYGIRLTVTFFIPWDALSDERTGLPFVCAAGPCQRSLSRS